MWHFSSSRFVQFVYINALLLFGSGTAHKSCLFLFCIMFSFENEPDETFDGLWENVYMLLTSPFSTEVHISQFFYTEIHIEKPNKY